MFLRRTSTGHATVPSGERQSRLAAQFLAFVLVAIFSTYTWLNIAAIGVLLAHVVFWIGLIGFFVVQSRGERGVLWIFPLFFLYYFTFFFSRHVPEAFDYVFNSDTIRYLELTGGWGAESRHAVWPTLLFIRPIMAVLDGGVWSVWVKEYLYAELALIGMLGVGSFYLLLRSLGGEKITSVLLSYTLGVSLAYWTFSSLLESYSISVFILLQLFIVLWRYVTGERSVWAVTMMGLLCAFALCVSQENIYFFVCVGVVLLSTRKMKTILGHGSFAAFVAFASYYCVLTAGRAAIGVRFYFIPEDWSPTDTMQSLASFWRVFSGGTSLLGSVHDVVRPLVTAPVMSVVAQPLDIATYSYEEFSPLWHMNLPYYGLLLAALAVALLGWRHATKKQQLVLAVAILVLGMRHFLMVVFCPWFNILFSPPTIAMLWLTIGVGVSQFLRRYPRWRTAAIIHLSLLMAYLGTINAEFLLYPR